MDEVLGWKFFDIDNSKTVEQEFDRLCMFARYLLPVHFGVVDRGHRTYFAQMSHRGFDMSCSIPMKTTDSRLPEGASMN